MLSSRRGWRPMEKFIVYIQLKNHPDAVSKIMLLVKQGQLRLDGATFTASDDGKALSAVLTLLGSRNKASWFTKKLLNFPFFTQAYMLPITEEEKQK